MPQSVAEAEVYYDSDSVYSECQSNSTLTVGAAKTAKEKKRRKVKTQMI